MISAIDEEDELAETNAGMACGLSDYSGNNDRTNELFTQKPGEEILTFISVDASGIRIEARRISDGQTVDRCEIIYGD